MAAFLLYLAAHWSLVIAVTLIAVGLGAAAFFLKNWKIALVAIFIVAAGLSFQGAVQHGINLEIAKQVAIKTKVLEGRLATYQTLAAKDTARALEDKKLNDALERLSSETPANDSKCFGIDATRRVQSIR